MELHHVFFIQGIPWATQKMLYPWATYEFWYRWATCSTLQFRNHDCFRRLSNRCTVVHSRCSRLYFGAHINFLGWSLCMIFISTRIKLFWIAIPSAWDSRFGIFCFFKDFWKSPATFDKPLPRNDNSRNSNLLNFSTISTIEQDKNSNWLILSII